MKSRRIGYGAISSELAFLSDVRLNALLSKATQCEHSIGVTTMLLELCGRKVFVKKIRLTDTERLPQNQMSTANLFDLPTFCQYGIGTDVGSPGFGVWRELASQILTTNWVLSGQCLNFPLLYHWRILREDRPESQVMLKSEIERSVEYWNNSLGVRKRLEENSKASMSVVLFLEYLPLRLDLWLAEKISGGGKEADSAVTFVEREALSTAAFMNQRGFFHFDAHFRNILTDGSGLYFSDFGLATSSRFELSPEEIKFYEQHRNYDRYYLGAHLANFVVRTLFGENERERVIDEFASGKYARPLSPVIETLLHRHAPVAAIMNQFFKSFLETSRKVQFPGSELCHAER